MSKKILIISSSPRKSGNTDILCERFAEGAIEAGNDTETIYLREKNIGNCLACDSCKRNGGECIRKDDMEDILRKMMGSDAIVMATPVYFYSMNAQMKNLIDRTYSRYLGIKDKEFYFMVTAADDDIKAMERTVEGFRGFTYCLEGAVEKGIIYGVGSWNKGDVKGKRAYDDAYGMGRSI
jgi:multimeric flavodoxin WrbA